MSEDQTLSRLEVLCRQVFGRDDITLNRETTAHDIDEWDSVNHFQLISAVEEEFGMRFSMSEVASLACVGDLVDVLEDKATR